MSLSFRLEFLQMKCLKRPFFHKSGYNLVQAENPIKGTYTLLGVCCWQSSPMLLQTKRPWHVWRELGQNWGHSCAETHTHTQIYMLYNLITVYFVKKTVKFNKTYVHTRIKCKNVTHNTLKKYAIKYVLL